MKKIGIVTEYDNYVGEIETENKEKYLLLEKDVCEEIKKDDYVIFDAETVMTTFEDRNVARFVKKLNKF